jgi:uncharacterized protein YndB with AHSA1/START domain
MNPRARPITTVIDPAIDPALHEVTLTRVFDAARPLVWAAWTEPEHLAGWWGPHGFDAPHPAVDLRAGGEANLDMRAPDRSLLPNRGVIEEVVPMEKLVVVTRAFEGDDGEPQLEVRSTVTFADEGEGKTRLTLTATVLRATAALAGALAGANQGWSESLDKLGEHMALERWTKSAKAGADGTTFVLPAGEPVVVITRTFDAPRERVWAAITEAEQRAQWWGPARLTNDVVELDVRPGGKWRIDQRAADGQVFSFSGEFREVRAPTRLVNTFCFADEPPMIETTTLSERNGKTTLVMVARGESVAGRDAAAEAGMEGGARESMNRLAALLARD